MKQRNRRPAEYNMINYENRDSMVMVDRAWLTHIVNILEGRKNGIYKRKLLEQLKIKIDENKFKIQIKDENSLLNHLIQ